MTKPPSEAIVSKDERIDLTRFEGIGDLKHNLFMEKTPTDGFHWSVCFENDVEAEMSTSSEFGRSIAEEADRFYHAINALPNLIAELNRIYENIDIVMESLREINSKETKNEVDGDLLLEWMDRLF